MATHRVELRYSLSQWHEHLELCYFASRVVRSPVTIYLILFCWRTWSKRAAVTGTSAYCRCHTPSLAGSRVLHVFPTESDSRSPTSHTFHCKAPGPRFQCPITENSFLQIFDQRFAHRSYYSTSWLQNLFYVGRMALFLLQLKVENIIYTPFEIFGIMSVCPSLKHCFNGMLAKFSTSQPDKVWLIVSIYGPEPVRPKLIVNSRFSGFPGFQPEP